MRRKVQGREPCDTVEKQLNLRRAFRRPPTSVKAADIEISKEGRDARVKKGPAEPSEPESELHSATHIPFRAWYHERRKIRTD